MEVLWYWLQLELDGSTKSSSRLLLQRNSGKFGDVESVYCAVKMMEYVNIAKQD